MLDNWHCLCPFVPELDYKLFPEYIFSSIDLKLAPTFAYKEGGQETVDK